MSSPTAEARPLTDPPPAQRDADLFEPPLRRIVTDAVDALRLLATQIEDQLLQESLSIDLRSVAGRASDDLLSALADVRIDIAVHETDELRETSVAKRDELLARITPAARRADVLFQRMRQVEDLRSEILRCRAKIDDFRAHQHRFESEKAELIRERNTLDADPSSNQARTRLDAQIRRREEDLISSANNIERKSAKLAELKRELARITEGIHDLEPHAANPSDGSDLGLERDIVTALSPIRRARHIPPPPPSPESEPRSRARFLAVIASIVVLSVIGVVLFGRPDEDPQAETTTVDPLLRTLTEEMVRHPYIGRLMTPEEKANILSAKTRQEAHALFAAVAGSGRRDPDFVAATDNKPAIEFLENEDEDLIAIRPHPALVEAVASLYGDSVRLGFRIDQDRLPPALRSMAMTRQEPLLLSVRLSRTLLCDHEVVGALFLRMEGPDDVGFEFELGDIPLAPLWRAGNSCPRPIQSPRGE